MKHKREFGSRKIQKLKERKSFNDELDSINDRLNRIAANNFVDPDMTDHFSSLPLFESTKQALQKCGFDVMSPIQKQTLTFTLCGRDLIGAAETGSGKTLSFLIPLIESLKRSSFSSSSSIGAIVISPTRDLAAQTYDVLKPLIDGTELSAGLVTGGMSFELEQEGFSRLNILIATVGRLKEHMENSHTFNTDNLQFLVLDEADRLMGKEFFKDLKHILASFTNIHQTLLFTATANKAIKELTKISLSNPAHVLLTDLKEYVTPDNLMQFYTIVPLSEKWNTLFSFLKSHLNDKIIVFMETIKTVRFAYEAFRHLRPGLPIMHLTGKQKSASRFAVCQDFAKQKRGAIFTTDVAARGLDFPEVNWVIQHDCPSSTDTYIHRVGRTARFHANGKALIMLTPHEKPMIEKLEKAKVQLKPIQISGDKLVDVRPRLIDIVSKFSEVKHLAMKAILTYARSIKLRNDNEVFNFDKFMEDIEGFSQSYGLLSVPVLTKSKSKNGSDDSSDSESSSDEIDETSRSTFFKVVEENDDDEEDQNDHSDSKIKPQTMEYLPADTPITNEEYQKWRSHLQGILGSLKSEKSVKRQSTVDDSEKGKTLEEEAAQLLLDDF